jgi:hypothetical protein
MRNGWSGSGFVLYSILEKDLIACSYPLQTSFSRDLICGLILITSYLGCGESRSQDEILPSTGYIHHTFEGKRLLVHETFCFRSWFVKSNHQMIPSVPLCIGKGARTVLSLQIYVGTSYNSAQANDLDLYLREFCVGLGAFHDRYYTKVFHAIVPGNTTRVLLMNS